MNKSYDIAIVGAGPAGAFFARELALCRPDMSILLIDGQTREKSKPCGGLLAPDAQKVLAEFSLTLPKDILADPQIFSVETIDIAQSCKRHYQRYYLNMDRYAFDAWLLSLVPDSVDIFKGRCEGMDCEGGVYKLRLSGEREVSASCLVGADGSNSAVRRRFFKRMPRQYIAIQEWYRDEGQSLPPYSCIFDRETSDSCSWTIRKDGYLIFGGAFDKKGCAAAFNLQKKRLCDHLGCSLGDAVKREACFVSSPRSMSDLICGGDGVFLLGEAAGFISASSFEGISSALISARTLARSFADSSEAARVLSSYQKHTAKLRLKLYLKSFKRWALCTPFTRKMIMTSGVQSIEVSKQGSDVPFAFKY